MEAFPDWQNLPDIALISIYSMLSDVNKLNAACTCKNWRRLFATPKLWRCRRIVLDTQTAELTAVRELKFIENLGHCLYKLSLNFGRPNFKNCMPISKAADVFLTGLSHRNDIHLHELDIESLHMEHYWHFILSRNRLVTALCRMIRKQKFLHTVYLAGARMRVIDGCRLLEALAKGATKGTIETIYMEDFFETNIFPYRNPRYVKAMSRFQSLRSLHTNYRYLNDEMVRNMANRLGPALEYMALVLEGDMRGMEISSEVWSEFAARCPKVEIEVCLCTTVVRGNDLRTPFVHGMPIHNIYLTSWTRADDTERRLAQLLRHLAILYKDTLETFAMFFENHESIDGEVLYMLRRCRHVKDLSVQARLSADTVVDIMRLHHEHRLALKSINLTIPGLSDTDWVRLDEARTQYLGNVHDFVYIGPKDYESTISSSSTEGDEPDPDDDDEIDELPENPYEEVFVHNLEFDASDDDFNDIFEPQPEPEVENGDVNNNDDQGDN